MPNATASPEAPTGQGQAGGTERKGALRTRLEQTGQSLREKQAAISKNLGSKLRRILKPSDPENVLRKLAEDEHPGAKLPKHRIRNFVTRDRLNKDDIAWALNDEQRDKVQDEVTTRKSKIEGKISRRQEKRIFRDAVRSRQAELVNPLLEKAQLERAGKISAIEGHQASDDLKLALEQRIYDRTAENRGKKPGKREQMRMKRDLTVDAMNGKPLTRARIKEAEVAAAQRDKSEAQQKRIEQLAERKKLMKHQDYKTTLAQQLQRLNPNAVGLEDPNAMAKLIESAQSATDKIIEQKVDTDKTTEGQTRSDERAKAVADGPYFSVLADKLISDPDSAGTPDLDQIVSDEAILAAKDTATKPAKPEVITAFPVDDILKVFNIDPDSPQAGEVRTKVSELVKDDDGSSEGGRDSVWKVIAGLISAGIIVVGSAANAAVDTASKATGS
jgi:hypothetical protein